MNSLKHISFGAQILQVKLGINELLYLSPLSQIDTKQTLRGGIPILFPQFGNFGNLKKHGFVRDRNWKLLNEENNPNDLFVEYEYVIDKDHFLDWKYSAKLNLKASVINNVFNITIQILNIGDSSFEFTGGLHPYFKIDSRSAIKINGLESTFFEDSFPEISFELSSDRVIERLYFTNNDIYFYNGSDNLVIKSKGFDSWMIWNPGKEGAKYINDLPNEDWNMFLCIEPIVQNVPVLLKPQEIFKGEFVIQLLK
jgi:glucose-6-phosphate 1-epimerase